MTYHTPIKVGDRVALAPHTDLWMAGHRYGTVERIANVTRPFLYHVRVSPNAVYWLPMDDLLGATRSTDEVDRDIRASLQGWGQ